MKVKVLKTFHEDKLNRRVQPDETITVTDAVGADLIRLGLAEEAEAPAKTEGKKADAPKAYAKTDSAKTEGKK